MNRHLVSIEVGIEGSTNQGVDLDGTTIDKYRLEGLNAETVKGGGTIEENWPLFDYIL
jgi:hypothetical protein